MLLYDVCKSGDMDMVNIAIEKGATGWNEGLKGACEGGHREIVDLMIKNGLLVLTLDFMVHV